MLHFMKLEKVSAGLVEGLLALVRGYLGHGLVRIG